MEQEQFNEEFKIDFQMYRQDEKKFKENWSRAYALIWKGYCAKEVQHAVEEMSEFEVRIKNYPLELLKEVETLMHVPQRAKYPPLTLVEILSNFLKVKQGDNESLLDYLSRYTSEV